MDMEKHAYRLVKLLDNTTTVFKDLVYYLTENFIEKPIEINEGIYYRTRDNRKIFIYKHIGNALYKGIDTNNDNIKYFYKNGMHDSRPENSLENIIGVWGE